MGERWNEATERRHGRTQRTDFTKELPAEASARVSRVGGRGGARTTAAVGSDFYFFFRREPAHARMSGHVKLVVLAGVLCAILYLLSRATASDAAGSASADSSIPAVRKHRRRHQRHYPAGISAPTQRCGWETSAVASIPPETNSTAAAALGGMLRFLDEEVGDRLGYLWTLRDGNLLGALRHKGLIPGDRDLDAAVLLPIDEGFDRLKAAVERRLVATRQPFTLQVNDDGKSRWLVFLQPNEDAKAEPHHADVIVYPSVLFSSPLRGYNRELVYATRQQRAFAGLCHCTHWPLARASCFEQAPAYLTGIYGNFLAPSGQHARGGNTLEEVYV